MAADHECRSAMGPAAAPNTLGHVADSVGWSRHAPGQSEWYTVVRPQDQPTLRDDELLVVRFHYVGPGGLEGLGLRFIPGRGISDQDREGNTGAVVLSESVTAAMWPGQNAIGKILRRAPCCYWRPPPSPATDRLAGLFTTVKTVAGSRSAEKPPIRRRPSENRSRPVYTYR